LTGWRGRRSIVLLLALAGACTASDPPGRTGGGPNVTIAPEVTGPLVVLAASSLTEPFNEMGRRFQTIHPAVSVSFSFGASSTLVQQVRSGAPADVLATADDPSIQDAVKAGSVARPVAFARSRLAIVVAKGNPKGIAGLADLARPGLIVVLCAPEVPCGRYAAQALARTATPVEPRSLEPNVKGVMAKVALGEADAGVVYQTDVKAGGDRVEGVTIPADQNVVATYFVAPLRQPRNASLATAFVDFVRSEEGRQVLSFVGFEPVGP
jgi:molybdate transport system substrate-binding protein